MSHAALFLAGPLTIGIAAPSHGQNNIAISKDLCSPAGCVSQGASPSVAPNTPVSYPIALTNTGPLPLTVNFRDVCQGLKDLQARTAATQKRWNFESNDFSTSMPVKGQCASGLIPVYGAYNNGFARGVDSNHRITANQAAYQEQVAKGWLGEGVVMCAPE